MEKRLVVAVALSILVIVAFQYFAAKPAQSPTGIPAPSGQPVAAAAKEEIIAPAQTRPIIEEEYFEAETGKFILEFSNIGGAIKTVRLKDFNNVGTDSPMELVSIEDPKEYIFNISSTHYPDLAMLNYSIKKEGDTIICYGKTKDFEITKRYILSNSKRCIELYVFIKNISGINKEFNYRIIGGSGITEKNEQDKQMIEVNGNINGKFFGYKRPKDERIINPGIVGWSALKNKYFSLIIKPFISTKAQFYSGNKAGQIVMGIDSEPCMILPGATVEQKFLLYAGPSQIDELKKIGYGLEESVNYGFFGIISKALIFVMKLFYNVVHSWGIAIILLSIFLNIVLFPLTLKSFKSMQKMQELHPQMEKLKIQYKDNPQRLNKEMLGLYKTYNINPMSGCLPMLLQMPIFIALYQALLKSIELRSTKFLWIKDLSMPDAMVIPITLPIFGDSINILPLIMVAAMVVQQKISTKSMGAAITEEQKQQQKMMLIIMPVVFGFIFYNMPSGLVLYWVVNTVLTIVEQGAILKKA